MLNGTVKTVGQRGAQIITNLIERLIRQGFGREIRRQLWQALISDNHIVYSPYTIALAVIFSIYSLHIVFIANDDYLVALIMEGPMGMGVDPSVIVHGIENLFSEPVYSQFNSYGTRAYGWVYNDINFIVILILKILGKIFGFYQQPIFSAVFDQPVLNGAIRAVTFTIALISVLLFYNVVNLLFGNRRLSFVTALFFMFIPFASNFAYHIHPDAAGMMFMLLAVRYLLLYINQKPIGIYFYISFVSLVLATLSKQSFLFISVPIILLFWVSHCRYAKTGYVSFFKSHAFVQTIIWMSVLSVSLLFIVHPYAIIDSDKFLDTQKYVTQSQTFGSGLTFAQSFQRWIDVYINEPIVVLNFLFLLFLVIYFSFLRGKFTLSSLWVISVVFCNIFLLIITPLGARLFFLTHYVYPILPLLLLNLVAAGLFFWKKLPLLGFSYIRPIFAVIVAVLVLFFLSKNMLWTVRSVLTITAYKHSTAYQAREFTLTHIPFDQPVLVDPSLAVSLNHVHACNTWNCSSYDAIDKLNPSFILLDDGSSQWVDHKLIYQYMSDHQYELVNDIKSNIIIPSSNDVGLLEIKLWIDLFNSTDSLFGNHILIFHKKN